MSSSRFLRKLQVIASLSVLLLMAAAVGCNGFFVDPVLTSMSVQTLQSTNLVNVGNTVQMQATRTNNHGTTKNLTATATPSVTSNSDFAKATPPTPPTPLKVSPTGT